MTALDDLVNIDPAAARDELHYLREVHAWALETQKVREGDAVVIARPIPNIDRASGWWVWREILVVGSTGTIVNEPTLGMNHHWYIRFKPDVQWTIGEGIIGRRHVDPARFAHFFLRVDLVRKRRRSDKPLAMPDDVKYWADLTRRAEAR